MPQLDIGTYFTQSFWLIIIFILLYILITNNFLVHLAFIIKSRDKYNYVRNFEQKVINNNCETSSIHLTFMDQKVYFKKLITKLNKQIDSYRTGVNLHNKAIIATFMETNISAKYSLLKETYTNYV